MHDKHTTQCTLEIYKGVLGLSNAQNAPFLVHYGLWIFQLGQIVGNILHVHADLLSTRLIHVVSGKFSLWGCIC